MPLFLGYYARQGTVGCYIPEYNFHEIIAALCAILKNQPCPELLPDIPDEPEISLEAYRNGYIKLFPRCTGYYEKGKNIVAEFTSDLDAEDFEVALEELTMRGDQILKEIGWEDKTVIMGKIIDRKKILELLEKSAAFSPEYKINMRLWDGGTLRKMTVEEILFDSVERILYHFKSNSQDALQYLQELSLQFKDSFKRESIVK